MQGALIRGIPAALLATLVQGLVALMFDLGVLYPLIGYSIGSVIRTGSPAINGRRRQILAAGLTYLAIALSPLIPFGNAVSFDLHRMQNAAIGSIIAFIPVMAKHGLVGILNVCLLLSALRWAWIYSVHAPVESKQSDKPTYTSQPG